MTIRLSRIHVKFIKDKMEVFLSLEMEGSVISSIIQSFKQGNCVNVKNCSLIDELNVIE